MCDQNNLNDQSVTNFKLKKRMCEQNNLKTNLLQTSNLKDLYVISLQILE